MKPTLTILLIASTAAPLGADCGQFFAYNKQAFVGGYSYGYKQAYYAPVYYSISTANQEAALLERAKRNDPDTIQDRIDAAAWRGFQEGLKAAGQQQQQSLRQSAIHQHCGACHIDKAEPDGGFNLSDVSDPVAFKAAMKRLSLPDDDPGHMPKGAKLTPEQKGQIMAEFLSSGDK